MFWCLCVWFSFEGRNYELQMLNDHGDYWRMPYLIVQVLSRADIINATVHV